MRSRKRVIWMDVRGTPANLINWSWKLSVENNCGQPLILKTAEGLGGEYGGNHVNCLFPDAAILCTEAVY